MIFLNVNYFLSIILLASALISLLLGYFSWQRDKKYAAIALIPVAIYSFGYAFEILCTSIEAVKFWIKVEYLGVSFLPVAWLLFAINFNGYRGRFKDRRLFLLYVIPIIILVLNYTNDFHHLFYKSLSMNTSGIFPMVEIVQGPWYWVNIAYTYSIMVLGLITFLSAYFKAVSIVKKQMVFLMIAWVIPWVSDIIYMFKVLPFRLDLCPFAFSISGLISSFAILKFKLLKITPIALEKVFSNMLDGVVILDYENNIVNFNNAAKKVISELKYIEAGDKKFDEVFKNYEELLLAANNDSCNESIINIENNKQLKYYRLNINKVYEKNGEVIGKILIFNDVTELLLQREALADNLNFIETLIDAIPNPIYSKDKDGVYNHCNAAFIEYIGIEKKQVIGQTAYEIFESESAEIYNYADKNLMESRETQVYESRLMHSDNTEHDVIFCKSVVTNEHGDNKGLIGVILDISEQKKSRERIDKLMTLKEAMLKIGYSINEISNINELLQLILDKVINCIDPRSCGSVLVLDDDENLKIAVAKGYKAEEIERFSIKLEDGWFNEEERSHKTVIVNDIDKINPTGMLDTEDGIKIKSAISAPIFIDDKCYGFINIDSVYSNIFDEIDRELMEYMGNQASIAISKHKLYEETIYLSRYDKLTNVYNRSYFEQEVKSIIAKDSMEVREFFVVVFDLNELKFINDNYGHLAGDELIRSFARGLTGLLRDSDIIGRFGGDEFVGVFFNVDLESLTNRFEKLIDDFRKNHISFGGERFICSYSYGIANYPKEDKEFDKLIKIADRRMYEYKHIIKSKNKVTK
ncbi:histidine kinase N-terminal 7TM domain-containing protein [Clostridium manihotivorum]|uniref:histidine kinase N-terminal 7TM domain-containing protein n=1 Tax=Clostridium manihotivorum TaxID=2320868 RepID=UPI0030846083